MNYAIVTDTSANLPTPTLKAHNVTVIPFSYYIDGKEYNCLNTEKFSGRKFYDLMRHGTIITTSQINPQKYVEHFTPILDAGQDILFIGMSSGISGAYQSSTIAAEQLRKKYPDRKIFTVDTKGASLGEGIPVLKAIEYREDGLTIEENVEKIYDFCKHLYQVFIVDDLMHLKRSGRISGAVALVGTMLQIKPIMKGNEKGQIINFDKVRGRKKAIEYLAEKYNKYAVDTKNQLVGIAHCDCEDDVEYLIELLNKDNPPEDILTVCYEPVTGSHVGPGTLALFFSGGDDVRSK
jgi:DegV family protein with EDD domain